jgi:serine/threonine-protein kinase
LRLAHEKGIVHRDIKPDNVFLAADALGRKQPKLLDFGIAKVDKQIDGRLTQVGAVLGSPDYMSPEQALGLDDIDERTDIWSLCVVLYEVITGKVPFQKPNYNALMHAIINEDPTPSVDCGAGDRSLWQIVERGLKKPREDRFQTVTDLGEALALWLYEHGVKEDLSGNSIRAVWLDSALSSGGVRETRSARPGTLDSGSIRHGVSKTPTLPAPHPSSAETMLTLPPREEARRKRMLYFVVPVFALLLGAVGAWAIVTLRAPSAMPAAALGTAAAAAKPAEPAPAVLEPAPASAATPAAVEPVPVTSAKALSSAAGKSKVRVPSARRRGHDFGF